MQQPIHNQLTLNSFYHVNSAKHSVLAIFTVQCAVCTVTLTCCKLQLVIINWNAIRDVCVCV